MSFADHLDLTSPRGVLGLEPIQESEVNGFSQELYCLQTDTVPVGLQTSYGTTTAGETFLYLKAFALSICCSGRLTMIATSIDDFKMTAFCYTCEQEAKGWDALAINEVDQGMSLFTARFDEDRATWSWVLTKKPFELALRSAVEYFTPNPLMSEIEYSTVAGKLGVACHVSLSHWGLKEVWPARWAVS